MELKIEYLPVDALVPYEGNARKHAPDDIDQIKASIEADGFNDPIGIWKGNVIIEGHGRLIAAKELGFETVPVIRLDHLTDTQRRDYAIRHNRTAELSGWDFGKLEEEIARLEIEGVDLSGLKFAFGGDDDWFQREEKDGTNRQEGNEEYNEFLDKFELKKTTDDCYTPDNIYNAVADWVAKEYNLNRSDFVRPFYPGGDYQNFQYKPNSVVVDNPPFSILSEIIKFYCSKGIRFFLFAPALTLFTAVGCDVEYMPEGCDILYENGATVKTSFINNLGENRIHVSSELFEAVDAENDKNLKEAHADLPKFIYPMECILSAIIQKLAYYGQTLKIPKDECIYKNRLDAQKDTGKDAFGGLFLISKRAAAERAAAERASATKWELSEDEKAVISRLCGKKQCE